MEIIINIENKDEAENTINEVARQIKLGNTSGIDPTWEITESSEDIEMLQRENKALARGFEKLGYTQNQISDIANSAI
jgi:hypothetical protein